MVDTFGGPDEALFRQLDGALALGDAQVHEPMRAGQRSADGVLERPKRFLLANPVLTDETAFGIGRGCKLGRQGNESPVDVFVFAALQLHIGAAQP